MKFEMKVNRTVFFSSASVIAIFVALGATFPKAMGHTTKAVRRHMSLNMGWFFSLAMTFFVGFVIWLLFSSHADLRLGKDGERPEFSNVSWFAMLFSAGIGTGLLFFGAAEPLLHYLSPPHADPQSTEAAKDALMLVFFHWGLHGWALYVIVGLALAYYAYRFDLPLTFRSVLYPLIGERVHGPIGDVVEILAVFATMFGIATSLGLGVLQVNAGLEHLGIMEKSVMNQMILIGIITVVATVSVVSGLDQGVRRLSELNFFIGIGLMLFVFVTGPTLFLVKGFVASFGHYAQNIVELSLMTDMFGQREQWMADWTLFYWGWWISWSPFVGMFIARISRGRTIREFILGVLGVPVTFIFLWMTIFGGTTMYMEHTGAASFPTGNLESSISQILYLMLEHLPFSGLAIGVAIFSGTVYFVTSSDSGSLVIDILTSGGVKDPPVWQRVFWAVSEGAIAAILLLAGGLEGLQAASLTTALPFSIVVLVACYGLVQAFKSEKRDEPIHIDMDKSSPAE